MQSEDEVGDRGGYVLRHCGGNRTIGMGMVMGMGM